jgi:hypothetical protein
MTSLVFPTATTPPPSDGNPRLLAAWAFNNAWNVSQQKAAQSDAYFNQAITAEGGPARMTPTPFSFTPNVDEPDVYIPYMAEGASVAKFYEMSTMVINQLADLYAGYMAKYFPDEVNYLLKSQEWIYNTLTNGGTGMNPHVEAQIWERDRSRVLKEADRDDEEALVQWAAKRYPMPPGAAIYQSLMIRKAAGDKIAESSRAVAIKQAEIEIENVRFAVENSIKLYAAASAAAGDYLKALAVGPTSAMQVVPSVTDSQAKLIGAASEYYRSRISVEELRLKASMPAAEWDQQSRIKNGDWVMEQVKAEVSAAIAAAQSVGTQAAASLNSLHAAVGVQNSTSDAVSYNYSNDTVSAAPTVTQVV